jgi:cytochrome c
MNPRIAPVAIAAALFSTTLIFGSGSASAADGKALFVEKGCPTCHGPNGAAPIAPNYPKLKGQNADYVVIQLKAFRSGERKGPNVALMQPMALNLTDEESVVIAKYLQDVQ